MKGTPIDMEVNQLLSKYSVATDINAIISLMYEKYGLDVQGSDSGEEYYVPREDQEWLVIGDAENTVPMFPEAFDAQAYKKSIERLADESLLGRIKSGFEAIGNKSRTMRTQELIEFGKKAGKRIDGFTDDEKENAANILSEEYMRLLENLDPIKYISLSRNPKYTELGHAFLDYLKNAGFYVPKIFLDISKDEQFYDYFSNGSQPIVTHDRRLDGVISTVDVFPYVSYFYYYNERVNRILAGHCKYYRFQDMEGE